MALDLAQLLDPSATAMLTMELQRGIVGDLTNLPALAVESQKTFPAVKRLLEAARDAGVPVVHCQAGPPSVPSAPPNYPLASALARRSGGAPRNPDGDQVVPEIGALPTDYYVPRHHGMTPFTGTELDAVLRRLGVRTVVAAGVSLNVGIIGLTVEAIGLGYRVVVVTDGVVGIPVEHAASVMEHTMGVIATRLTSDQIAEVWAAAPVRAAG